MVSLATLLSLYLGFGLPAQPLVRGGPPQGHWSRDEREISERGAREEMFEVMGVGEGTFASTCFDTRAPGRSIGGCWLGGGECKIPKEQMAF